MTKKKITTKEEAISFLIEKAGINVEVVDYEYRVFDSDFNSPIKDAKELIEYANEQKEAIGEYDYTSDSEDEENFNKIKCEICKKEIPLDLENNCNEYYIQCPFCFSQFKNKFYNHKKATKC